MNVQSTVNSTPPSKPTTSTADSATPAVKGSLPRGRAVSILTKEVAALKKEYMRQEEFPEVAFGCASILVAGFVAFFAINCWGSVTAAASTAFAVVGLALPPVAIALITMIAVPLILGFGTGSVLYFFAKREREEAENLIKVLENVADKLGSGGRRDDQLNETEMKELLEASKVQPNLHKEILKQLQASKREFEQRLAMRTKTSEVAQPLPPQQQAAKLTEKASPAPRKECEDSPFFKELKAAQKARELRMINSNKEIVLTK